MCTTDVVVIGAGPTGLTLANLLADWGIRVTVVEKRSSTGDEPRAISVTDETLRVMAQIGIMDRLAPQMLLDTGARYFGRHDQLLAEVHPGTPVLGQPRKSQFDQPIMEQLLHHAARTRTNITLRFSTEALALADHGESVTVAVADAAGPDTIQARWVVACDGGRSPTRHHLRIALDGSTQVEKWIVLDLLNDTHHEHFSEFHCDGKRPHVIVPVGGGRCRYEFMLLPGEDATAMTSRSAIAELLRPYRAVAPAEIRRAAVYVAQQRVAQTYRRERILLAGDAAHLMPPFAGQGLNAGIRDAANLAWKLATCIHGSGTSALIDTYQRERRPHAVQMIKLSHRIGQIVMTTDSRITPIRDAAITALSVLPTVKDWIVGMRFVRPPHLTQGCVVAASPALPTAAAALVGRSLPQPEVQTTDATTTPLDKVLGTGWALITLGGHPPRHGTPPWPGLTPRQIFIHRGVGSAPSRAGVVSVVDSSGVFTELAAGTESVMLLIRPDRYVAAAFRPQEAADVTAALAPYLAVPAGQPSVA